MLPNGLSEVPPFPVMTQLKPSVSTMVGVSVRGVGDKALPSQGALHTQASPRSVPRTVAIPTCQMSCSDVEAVELFDAAANSPLVEPCELDVAVLERLNKELPLGYIKLKTDKYLVAVCDTIGTERHLYCRVRCRGMVSGARFNWHTVRIRVIDYVVV